MRAKLWIAIYILIILSGFGIAPAFAQDSTLQILVRDSMGTPLPDVTVSLYHNGPPHEFIESKTTDSSGIAGFAAGPGSYLVAFAGAWQGTTFVNASQQNAGSSTDGDIGGFAIYADPTTPDWLFTFVVTQSEDGSLIPLWDMSRDGSVPPQPFTFEGVLDPETGHSIDADIPAGLPTPLNNPGQPVPTQTKTPVAVSEATLAQPISTQPAPAPAETAKGNVSIPLLISLILSGAVLIVLIVAIRRRQQAER